MDTNWKIGGYDAGHTDDVYVTSRIVNVPGEEDTGGLGTGVSLDVYPATLYTPARPLETDYKYNWYDYKYSETGSHLTVLGSYTFRFPGEFVPYFDSGCCIINFRWMITSRDYDADKPPVFNYKMDWLKDTVVHTLYKVKIGGYWFYRGLLAGRVAEQLVSPELVFDYQYTRLPAVLPEGESKVIEYDRLNLDISLFRAFFTIDKWLWPSDAKSESDSDWSELVDAE